MTTTQHTCNGNPANGPVCSHLATPAVVGALGFPVKVVDKCVGAVVTVTPGTTLETAKHLATCAGLVRTCTRTGR